MTTFYDFTPTQQQAFQFSPTLDGQTYIGTVTWNTFGQRYYLTITTLNSELIAHVPLIGSPVWVNISSITYANGRATVVTDTPHGFTVGAQVPVQMAGNSPAVYNGTFQAVIVDLYTFIIPMPFDPGATVSVGITGYDTNLAGGYFTETTLVYRPANMQFETDP